MRNSFYDNHSTISRMKRHAFSNVKNESELDMYTPPGRSTIIYLRNQNTLSIVYINIIVIIKSHTIRTKFSKCEYQFPFTFRDTTLVCWNLCLQVFKMKFIHNKIMNSWKTKAWYIWCLSDLLLTFFKEYEMSMSFHGGINLQFTFKVIMTLFVEIYVYMF